MQTYPPFEAAVGGRTTDPADPEALKPGRAGGAVPEGDARLAGRVLACEGGQRALLVALVEGIRGI